MPGNENTKSGILQGLFIRRNSELNPRVFLWKLFPILNGNTLIQGDSNYRFGVWLVANSFNLSESTRRE